MTQPLLDSTLQDCVSNRLLERDGQTVEELAKYYKTTEANIHGAMLVLQRKGHVAQFKTKWYLTRPHKKA
jgi:hypothetical protein